MLCLQKYSLELELYTFIGLLGFIGFEGRPVIEIIE